MEKNIKFLLEKAKEDLLNYPVENKKDKIKFWIKKNIMRRNVQAADRFFWPHGMLAQFLLEYYQITKDEQTLDILKSYYQRWIDKGEVLSNVDNVMNGYTLVSLYEITEKTQYKNALEHMQKFLLSSPTAKDGSLLYRKNQKDIVYADTIGMTCPFLCRYGILTNDCNLVEKAILTINNFCENGMDKESGLPYHGYNAASGEKLGIIGWGRAVGWIVWGMAESIIHLPETDRKPLVPLYKNLIDATIKYQRRDGLFSWQLQAVEGPADISATGMILASMQLMIKCGELSEEYVAYVDKAIVSVNQNEKIAYQSLAECEGLGCYPQKYGCNPWGIATEGILCLRAEK